MSQDIVDAANRHGVIPVGLIDYYVEKDKWDNDVSIISICDGEKYRMVHYSPRQKYWRRKSTIYAGRGKFAKVHISNPDSDTQEKSIEIGPYRVSWGDGDNLGVDYNGESLYDNPTRDPLNLYATLHAIDDDNFDLVIVNVLAVAGRDCESFWQIKETKP